MAAPSLLEAKSALTGPLLVKAIMPAEVSSTGAREGYESYRLKLERTRAAPPFCQRCCQKVSPTPNWRLRPMEVAPRLFWRTKPLEVQLVMVESVGRSVPRNLKVPLSWLSTIRRVLIPE